MVSDFLINIKIAITNLNQIKIKIINKNGKIDSMAENASSSRTVAWALRSNRRHMKKMEKGEGIFVYLFFSLW